MSGFKSDLVDACVLYLYKTDRAVLVEDGDKNEIWLPRSHTEFDPDPYIDQNVQRRTPMEVTLPQWLAKEKGLI